MGFFSTIFPYFDLKCAAKCVNCKFERLNEDTDNYNYEYATLDERVEISVLKDTLSLVLSTKKDLEDKAKSSLVAITISSALIFNIINLLNDLFELNRTIYIFTMIVSFLSLTYMVVAGALSLYMLSEKNRVYYLFPKDTLRSEEEQKKKLAICIEKNYLTNLHRNNLMNTSYKSITISIVLIVIIFLVSAVAMLVFYSSPIVKPPAVNTLLLNTTNLLEKSSSEFKILLSKL